MLDLVPYADIEWVAFQRQRMFEVREFLVTQPGRLTQRTGLTDVAHSRILIGKATFEGHQHMPAFPDELGNTCEKRVVGNVERRHDEKLVLVEVGAWKNEVHLDI